jgi:hypothetical protein
MNQPGLSELQTIEYASNEKAEMESHMACADLPEEDQQILVPCNQKTKDTHVTGVATSVREEMCRFVANDQYYGAKPLCMPRET